MNPATLMPVTQCTATCRRWFCGCAQNRATAPMNPWTISSLGTGSLQSAAGAASPSGSGGAHGSARYSTSQSRFHSSVSYRRRPSDCGVVRSTTRPTLSSSVSCRSMNIETEKSCSSLNSSLNLLASPHMSQSIGVFSGMNPVSGLPMRGAESQIDRSGGDIIADVRACVCACCEFLLCLERGLCVDGRTVTGLEHRRRRQFPVHDTCTNIRYTCTQVQVCHWPRRPFTH